MVRLLKANFARLWKTKSFWVCLILAFGLGLANFLMATLMIMDWTSEPVSSPN